MATAIVYRRTEAGKAACEQQDSSVPAEYRRLLALIEGDTHPDHLRGRLANYSDAQTRNLLAALVARGLLQEVESAAEQDLDFTGNFTRAQLMR
jgi:hypothetical protein